MSGNTVGILEVLEYRGTRDDAPIMGPIEGLWTGISVTHSAARLTFKDGALDNDRISRLMALNGEDKTIFRALHDHSGKVTSYELYFSYWPKIEANGDDFNPISKGSRLEDPHYDSTISELGSPIQYSKEATEYLHPHKSVVHSSIPILKELLPGKTITLAPSIVLHATPLGNTFGKPAEKLAMDFAVNYEAWRRLTIEKGSDTQISIARLNMLKSQNTLQKEMFPHRTMSHSQFLVELRPFVTFGNTERDTVSLPIASRAQGNKSALVLEDMADHVLKIGEHPDMYAYNLASHNCANQTQNLMIAGTPKDASQQFKSILTAPTPEFGVVLPGRVTHRAIDLAEVIDKETGLHAEADKENTLVGRGVRHNHDNHLNKIHPSLGTLKEKPQNNQETHHAPEGFKSKIGAELHRLTPTPPTDTGG